jgi:hypothetical protein
MTLKERLSDILRFMLVVMGGACIGIVVIVVIIILILILW